MTQGQFKLLSAKLDSNLEWSVTSSNYKFMLKSHRATVEILIKENAKLLAESTKIIQESKKRISETTEKVEKLHDEVTKFMADFWRSSDENTEAINKVIAGLGSTLQIEKEALSRVRSEI